jgi:hypothetical protein
LAVLHFFLYLTRSETSIAQTNLASHLISSCFGFLIFKIYFLKLVRGVNPMAIQGVKRKLTAILSADVEGYSRLMGDNEIATVL